MGFLKIHQGKSKPAKKKPGWQKEAAEYEAWLAKVNSMTRAGKKAVLAKAPSTRVNPVVPDTPVVSPDRLNRPPSLRTFGGAGTKPVARPDILYKDDPEMLERELKARERKFTVAPLYNKGGDQLVTDEAMKDIMAGVTRRR